MKYRSKVSKFGNKIFNLPVKVVILMKAVSRSSGGMSSALDLAETIHTLGFQTHIGLISGHLYYRIRGKKNCSTTIPDRLIHTIPGEYQETSKLRKKRTRNLRVSLLKALGERKGYFLKLVKESDLIVDAASLSKDSVTKLRALTNAPVICNHAGSPDQFQNWLDKIVMDKSRSSLEKYIEFCHRYDGILFQAKDQADTCIERTNLSKSRCFVLSPSSEEKAVLRSRQADSPYSEASKNIVVVGSMHSRKAQHFAIQAFKILETQYPATNLHFVGGGSESEYGKYLSTLVQELELVDRVFFHNHRTDYLRFMAHADMVVQTSVMEGVSRILRESMLLKRPIVSFSIPGTSSILDPEEEALLVEKGNIEELAKAMSRLLSNPEERVRIGESAYQKYLLNHSWPVYAMNVSKMITYFSARNFPFGID